MGTPQRAWYGKQWDGESDEFYIRSLAGSEALRNLRELNLTPLAVLQVQLLLDWPFGFVARHRDSELALVAGWGGCS